MGNESCCHSPINKEDESFREPKKQIASSTERSANDPLGPIINSSSPEVQLPFLNSDSKVLRITSQKSPSGIVFQSNPSPFTPIETANELYSKRVGDPTVFSPPQEILDLVQKYGAFSFLEQNYPGSANPYRELVRGDTKYLGQVDQNGKMQGKGQLSTPTCLHIGYFDRDMKYGPGKTYLSNLQFIEATWQDDLLDGPCIYYNDEQRQSSKNNYIKNKKHGPAEEIWADGSYFKGEYKDGLKDGKGEMRWPDGNIYKGDFKKGHIEGFGVYTWADGKFYKGEWKNDQMNGQGEFQWPDGRKYVGQYKDDLKDGYGVFHWTDVKRYEGTWSKGKQNGKGKYYNEKGELKEGIWVNGTR